MNKTETNNQIDALDRLILNELTENARIPFSGLAKKLKVSNSLIHQRVEKLESKGILKAPRYAIDAYQLGYETCAFTQIIVSQPKFMKLVIHELEKIPEIVECVNTVGRYSVMIKVFAINNRHLRDIVYEKIQSIKGVEETNTMITFETNFIRSLKP